MAKKSKTQRAKASAKRAEKRTQETEAEETLEVVEAEAGPQEEKKGFKNPFKKSSDAAENTDNTSKQPAKAERKTAAKEEKEAKKPKKSGFFKEVRAEMKRVTWPSRQDIIRWSGVVVVALVFFGVFVFVLDNWVVTPLLFAISSLGA